MPDFLPAPLPRMSMDQQAPPPAMPMMEGQQGAFDIREKTLDPRYDTADDRNLGALVRRADEAEESTYEARTKSERDRDYLDGKQLTQEEYDALVRRGQPPIAFNVIRSRVEFHQGMEKRQRRDPKAEPRTDKDTQGAEAFTDGMRYVVQRADYSTHRSEAWRNVTVEGYGGVELWITPSKDGNYDIHMGVLPWDRLLIDPHSSKIHFTDAKYMGLVTWMDWEDAVDKYWEACEERGVDVRDILTETTRPRSMNDTFDDKPRKNLWSDSRRKRVKVVTMWVHEVDGWRFYDFTLGGILDEGDSPFIDSDTGESLCPWVLTSCFMDRENNRYGVVRDLIDPQDELNKRRSKSLHLLNSVGAVFDTDAVESMEKLRRELAKPNFMISKRPGSELRIERNTELAQGQVMLMQSAMSYVLESGPNKALLGDSPDQSGKAIGLQQAGGLVEQADLLDHLRNFDLRVFRLVAQLMKQWWTAEKWIRVTDDELNPRWVGFNVPEPVMEQVQDPMTGEMAQQPQVDPYTGEPVTQLSNIPAELDMDIIVTDAEVQVTLEDENYQSLMQLLQSFGNMPPQLIRLAIELHPSLPARRKKQALDILEQIEKQAAQQQQQAMQQQGPIQQLQAGKLQADTEKVKVDTIAAVVDTQLKMRHGDADAVARRQPKPMPGQRPGQRQGGAPRDPERVMGQGPLERPAVNIR